MSENFKQDKLKNFTVIRNEIIEDNELSFKALGLAVFMLHLPSDWTFSVSGLSKVTGKSQSKIKTALQELEEKGYLKRHQSLVGSRFGGMVYEISDKLKSENFPSAEISTAEISTAEFSTAGKSLLLNTKEQNTNLPITKSPSTKDINTEFENLWSIYPKKQGRDKALGHYQRARKADTTYEEVEQGIKAYVEYINANGIDLQYVKQGSTFFSQKAWNDDWGIRNGKSGNDFRRGSQERPGVERATLGSERDYAKDRARLPGMVYGIQEES